MLILQQVFAHSYICSAAKESKMLPVVLEIVKFGPEKMCILGTAGVGFHPNGSQLYLHLSLNELWCLLAEGCCDGMLWFI